MKVGDLILYKGAVYKIESFYPNAFLGHSPVVWMDGKMTIVKDYTELPKSSVLEAIYEEV